jgi:zinc transport system substrate-binding protein
VGFESRAGARAAPDPEHAATYRDNARRGQAELERLIGEVRERLEAAGEPRFIVFHDAYQYFERRFDVPAAGAISLGNASDPSPSRIRGIQREVAELGIDCVFSEPQFNPDLVRSVFGGMAVDTSTVIDPLGVGHEPGPDLYAGVIRDLAASVAQCAETR